MRQGINKLNKVLVFGVFDLFHPGHRYFLQQAAKLGHKLLVVITRNRIAQKIKGCLPQQNQQTRLRQIAKLPYVTGACLGNNKINHHFAMVKKLQPQIIALGYDQYLKSIKVLKNKLQQRKIKTKIIRIKPYQTAIYKSSLLKNRLGSLSKRIDKSINTNYYNSTN